MPTSSSTPNSSPKRGPIERIRNAFRALLGRDFAWGHAEGHAARHAAGLPPDGASQLADLTRGISIVADLSSTMAQVCDGTTRLVGCARAAIFLLEGDRYVPHSDAGLASGRVPLFGDEGLASDSPLVQRLISTGREVALREGEDDELIDSRPAREAGMRSMLVAPIPDTSGQPRGFLTAERGDDQPAFEPADAILLRSIATLASIPISLHAAREKQEALEARIANVANLEPISRFAGTVAQDFSNRLTVIIGLAELITEQTRGTDIEGDLEELMRSAEAAAMLTQRLLEISSGRVDGVGRCNLSNAVNESHGILRRLVPADIDLSINVLENDLYAAVANQEFERILSNLVMNAADACEAEDSIELRLWSIELSGDRSTEWSELPEGRYACVSVRDSGAGIAPEDLDEIFEPFRSSGRKRLGPRFGLATVYGLVHGAGGAISAESLAGEGSTFTFLLPIDLDADLEDLELRPDPVLTDQRATILLVEDNESVRSFVRGVLVQTGHRVLEASSGRHALEVVEQTREPIQLLVTDVVMPDLGGVDLADELEKHIPDLQVLFISGYAPGFRGDRVAQSRDRAFLPKPFSTTRLLEEVDARLARLRHLN